MISDVVPRFVTAEDLKTIAQQHGYDLTEAPLEPKKPQLSVTSRIVINSLTNDFIDNRRFPHDFGDYYDDIQRDVKILAGEVGDRHALPPDEHKQLVDLLTNQEENKQDILALLYDPNQAIPGWTEDQRNNMVRIIENWLHVHPFNE